MYVSLLGIYLYASARVTTITMLMTNASLRGLMYHVPMMK